jgi:hypothetical protein
VASSLANYKNTGVAISEDPEGDKFVTVFIDELLTHKL